MNLGHRNLRISCGWYRWQSVTEVCWCPRVMLTDHTQMIKLSPDPGPTGDGWAEQGSETRRRYAGTLSRLGLVLARRAASSLSAIVIVLSITSIGVSSRDRCGWLVKVMVIVSIPLVTASHRLHIAHWAIDVKLWRCPSFASWIRSRIICRTQNLSWKWINLSNF